ncbi:formate-dependent nitrite reductase complex subunit NrfG [Salmonella enterica subsp. enterica]|uniref:Formate-dependent nitrite reductase complex subunit NrfG n=1 Tax=Salmonella enterica I TaxID=59201 RepID=A0A447MZR9_SALET|nr:formate-dependent nitrite reductase complex subunit NrfG [Salmonella enterica subsp. enterica]
MRYDNALLAYRQALRLRGDNAQLFAALATVLYYQAGQHMTPATREMINKALALDATEVTAQDAAGGGCVYGRRIMRKPCRCGKPYWMPTRRE